MTTESVEKIFNNILSSTMSKQDKLFLVSHSIDLLKAVGESCSGLAKNESLILSPSRTAASYGNARKQHGDIIAESIENMIINVETGIKAQAEKHGLNLNPQDPLAIRRDKVILTDQNAGKGICLELYSSNIDLIERFKYLGLVNLPKEMTPFHQANCKDFQMFEMWKPNSTVLKKIGGLIAAELDLPFYLDLKEHKTVISEDDIPTRDFEAFDINLHVHDDFFS